MHNSNTFKEVVTDCIQYTLDNMGKDVHNMSLNCSDLEDVKDIYEIGIDK